MSRVLLTGATGFIGGACLRLLEAAGHEVHAVARLPPPPPGGRVLWHAVDLLDATATARLVRSVAPEKLLHLAWYAVPGAYWTSPENLAWVQASLGLARAFAEAGGRRFVAAGTCAEYDWSQGVCDERLTPRAPRGLYGASKDALRQVLEAYFTQVKGSFAWGRIFFLYGPREPANRLVSSVAAALLQGKEAKTSHGEQQRDFLHVDDVAAGFVSLLEGELEGAVNIASGEPVKVRALVETLAELAGQPQLLKLGALPATDDAPLVVGESRRLRSAGWVPRFSLSDGLADTLAWWRSSLGR